MARLSNLERTLDLGDPGGRQESPAGIVALFVLTHNLGMIARIDFLKTLGQPNVTME
jgi:hypothetical protein